MNTLVFAEQTVFAGTNALLPLCESLTSAKHSKLLIVSDPGEAWHFLVFFLAFSQAPGVTAAGLVSKVQETLAQFGHKSETFLKCHPNPGIKDVAEIAKSFIHHGLATPHCPFHS